MWIEFSRLAIGLLIALFHRPIADFILEQEHWFSSHMRARGLMVPMPLRRTTAHTVYFSLGIFVALFEMGRIWTAL